MSAACRQADLAAWRQRLKKSFSAEAHTRVSRLYAIFFKSCNALCMNSNAWQSTQGRPGKRNRKKDITVTAWNPECSSNEGTSRDLVMPGENPFYQDPHLHPCKVRAAYARALPISVQVLTSWVRTSKAWECFAVWPFPNPAQALFCLMLNTFSPHPLSLKWKSPVLPHRWVNSSQIGCK